ncbi:NAD-dependent epimerase/dehydratase family protein [candidate division KSB1 bacterium]
MKVLVTGGAGFIGSHLADAFLDRGHSVDIIDNLSTGFEDNVPRKAKLYTCSFGDTDAEKILSGGYDIVCHYAAQIDLRKSVDDPLSDLKNDVVDSVRFLQWAVRHKVKHLVFASSGGAIYGEQFSFPADEQHPISPESPYGLHKWMIERYLHYFHKAFGLRYSAMRYANIYGPRQNSSSEAGVVAVFATRLLSGNEATINGTGEQTRDFVYVSDAVSAAVVSVEQKYCGEVNIATGRETSVNTLFALIRDAAGSDRQPQYGPAKKGEQFRSVLSAVKAKRELGWSPEVSIENGIPKTVEYFKSRIV